MIMIADIRPELRKELYDNIDRVINAQGKGSLIPITKPYPGFYHTTLFKDIRKGKPETIKQYPLNRLLNIFLKVCDAVAFGNAKGVTVPST